MNHFILFAHIIIISGLTLVALRFGKEIVIAWLSILALSMNLFVMKEITLFGLHVTASDALSVGYLLGLNITQEFFGRKIARQCVWISLFSSCSFLLLSQIHLLYFPNHHDTSQIHFLSLFASMPRIIGASLLSFLVVQLIDVATFSYLKERLEGKYLALRTTVTLIFSQTIDTLLFSYLGLYGLVESISHIIFLSLLVKVIVILLSTPCLMISKKVVSYNV